MSDDRLGNLRVLTMQGFSFPLNVEQICEEFVTKHNRKLCTTSVLYDLYGYHGGWLATPSTPTGSAPANTLV